MKPGKDYIGVGVGAMIFNDKGELLLKKRSGEVRNERGCWEIPGGAVKFGETMAQSIVREVKEEVNLNVVIVEQLMAFDHLIPDEGQHTGRAHLPEPAGRSDKHDAEAKQQRAESR